MDGYYVYILECSNHHYYTGITTDPVRRWQQHCQGTAAKYTRSFPPRRMLGLWSLAASRSLAQRIEAQIKSWSRQEKTGLLAYPEQLRERLAAVGIECEDIETAALIE